MLTKVEKELGVEDEPAYFDRSVEPALNKKAWTPSYLCVSSPLNTNGVRGPVQDDGDAYTVGCAAKELGVSQSVPIALCEDLGLDVSVGAQHTLAEYMEALDSSRVPAGWLVKTDFLREASTSDTIYNEFRKDKNLGDDLEVRGIIFVNPDYISEIQDYKAERKMRFAERRKEEWQEMKRTNPDAHRKARRMSRYAINGGNPSANPRGDMAERLKTHYTSSDIILMYGLENARGIVFLVRSGRLPPATMTIDSKSYWNKETLDKFRAEKERAMAEGERELLLEDAASELCVSLKKMRVLVSSGYVRPVRKPAHGVPIVILKSELDRFRREGGVCSPFISFVDVEEDIGRKEARRLFASGELGEVEMIDERKHASRERFLEWKKSHGKD